MVLRLRFAPSLVAIALWLLAATAFYALVPHPAFFNPRYGVVRFYDHTARNPFARRVLAGELIRIGVAAIPGPIRAVIDERLLPVTQPRGGRPEHGTVIFVAAGLTVLSLAVFLGLLALGIRTLGVSPWLAVGLSLLGVPLLHVFTNFQVFAYDHLVLALFAAASLCLWRRGAGNGILDVLIAVAAVAKETAVLLTIAALAVDDGPITQRLGRFVRRVAIVALIQTGLVLMVSDRPGFPVEEHIRENWVLVTQWRNWFAFQPFESTVLFPGGLPFGRPVGFNLFVWVPLFALAMRGARREWRLARALVVMAIPLVPLQLMFGMFNEVRDLYELLPALLWLAVAGAMPAEGREHARQRRPARAAAADG